MVLNFWKSHDISFFCMNGHEEPVPMVIMEGDTPFYACPRYMAMDEKHPDGHGPDEPMCMNRFSLTDAEEVVIKLSKIIEEDILNDVYGDYNGHVYEYKKLTVTVLLYEDAPDDDDIKEKPLIYLGVLNRLRARSQ